jgi:hypothetical protein
MMIGMHADVDRRGSEPRVQRQDAMTSVQLKNRRTPLSVLALILTAALGACTTTRLEEPNVLRTPYDSTQVWAVAPFENESGVSVADGTKLADAFIAQVEQVDGLETLPLNRTIAAMNALGLQSIRTPAEARTLLNTLGADGLVVGTITAWDPYPPLNLGAAVALFTRDQAPQIGSPRELTLNPRGEAMIDDDQSSVTTASGIFDASNHRTLTWLQDFARGRHVPDSAFGPEIYKSSMSLYTEFVSYALIHDLLVRESTKVAAASPPPASPGPPGPPTASR